MSEAVFKVEVKVGGDAFQPTPWPELARIFQGLVNDMHKEFVCVTLKDINGNTVGSTDFADAGIEQRIVTVPKKKGKR
jgi:hypothetical protein